MKRKKKIKKSFKKYLKTNFSINIASTLAVQTKARLDSIAIKGECFCEDKPEPEPGVDIIVVVDGSDSYNSKAEAAGSIPEGGAYAGPVTARQKYFFPRVPGALPGRNNCALIQFSGNKHLEGSYKPGSDGKTSSPEVPFFLSFFFK